MNISAISNTIGNTNKKNSNIASIPNNTGFGKNIISVVLAKGMESDGFSKLVDVTSGSKVNIVKHLSALNGLLISGMYVNKTLKSDLDPKRKNILAINQASVGIIATILGYTFDQIANEKIDQFIDRFRAANLKKFGSNAVSKMGTFNGGIKAATSMIIFASVYRFISPVIVTPIANKIGNSIQAKNEQKALAAKNEANQIQGQNLKKIA